MNRASAALIAAVACLALLGAVGRAGCSRMPASGRAVIRYCQWSIAEHQPVVWKLKEIFEKENPDIEVQLEFYPRDYWVKLPTMIAADVAPDVFYLSAPFTPDLARTGLILDLTPYIERDKLDLSQYYEVIVNSFRYKGPLYGLPMQFGNIGLYYNKDLFDRAGAPYPTDDWTWDDLLRAAQKLTLDKNGDGVPEQYGFAADPSLESCVFNFVGQAGGDVLDARGTRCLMDSPEAIEAMRFLLDLREKYKVSPRLGRGNEGMDANKMFETGLLAMQCDGSWMMDKFNKARVLNYDVAALPHFRRHFTVANGLANGINSHSPNKEAAWRWVKFYASPEAQRCLGLYKRGIPVMKRVANSDAFLNEKMPPENEKVFLAQMAYAHDFYPSVARQQVDVLARDDIECALNGQKTPEQAMKDMAVKVNALLAEALAGK